MSYSVFDWLLIWHLKQLAYLLLALRTGGRRLNLKQEQEQHRRVSPCTQRGLSVPCTPEGIIFAYGEQKGVSAAEA
jgi:hypothetical protein